MPFRLSGTKVNEISLVDEGAIQRKFLIFKNKNSKSEKGSKLMDNKELLEMGLITKAQFDALEKAKEENPDDKKVDSNIIKELLTSVSKLLSKKSEGEGEGEGEGKKKEGEGKGKEKKETEKSNEDIKKLQETVDKLQKDMESSVKLQELVTKLNSCEDPKEYLKVLKEIKEFTKKEEKPETNDEKVGKVLDGIAKRLEKIELQSKGLRGQESVEKGKTSEWGGIFK